jgi:hypothetical protein
MFTDYQFEQLEYLLDWQIIPAMANGARNLLVRARVDHRWPAPGESLDESPNSGNDKCAMARSRQKKAIADAIKESNY